MFTDTHCHLEQTDDPGGTLARARKAGVGRVVSVSEDPASGRRALELARLFPGWVLPGVGLHPMHVPALSEHAIEEALRWVEESLPSARVLGEVGLDHKVATTDPDKERQRRALLVQLDLAERAGRPANFHSRRAERATLEIAIEFHRRTGLGAQMHWFTHSKKLVRIANEAGIHVSVGPSLVGDDDVRRVVAEIDPALVLLETDTPVPIHGRANEPARVVEVARELAAIHGWSLEETIRRTEENFERFLGTSPFLAPRDGAPLEMDLGPG